MAETSTVVTTGTATGTVTQTVTKPGYKTTEFWLALVATLVTALYASGVIGAGGSLDKGLAFIAAALGALGYSVSRGLTKSA